VRLARETAANKVNWFEIVCPAFSDIVIPRNVRPVLREYALAIIVKLDLPSALHACPF